MKSKQPRTYTTLLLLTVAALLIRIWRLGEASLQIDNLLFWDLFRQDVSPGLIFSEWMNRTGLTGQLPFPAATAKLFLDMTRLPLSFATMILPFTLCGVLAVPVAYFAGREFGGRRMALLLAALTAFSPMCIQMSREAYFYSPAFLGAFLALWAAGLSGHLLQGGRFPRYFHAVNAAAFLIMTWSSPSTWPYAFLFALFNLSVFGWQAIRHRRHFADLIATAAVYLLIGLPLLIAPWGLEQIRQFTADGATRDYWTKVFATGRGVSQWTRVWPVLCAYAWGITPVRQIFSALVVLSGMIAYIAGFRKNRTFAVLGVISAAVLMLNILAVEKSVWYFGITRAVPLAPFYLLFLAAGLLYPFETLNAGRLRFLLLSLPAAGFLLWVPADLLIPQMTGIPRPFAGLSAWVDDTLPEDTPVLTDRYFTAYNEFRVHAPKTVQFVSTVPNQIPEQYSGFQFRKRTLEFIDSNPVCALFEEKHLWNRPETGPWTEVHGRFARTRTLTNRAGLRLAQIGLYYRGDPSLPVEPDAFDATVYYNLPEDVADRARAAELTAVAFFSKGWKTVSTRDYRLWRLMTSEAEIEVWNLTDAPQSVSLVVQAVAAGGAKQVELTGGEKKLFPNGQPIQWLSSPLTLHPGKNRLMLRDPLQNSAVPLLAAAVDVQP